MLTRCPLTEQDDFFSLWVEYQHMQVRMEDACMLFPSLNRADMLTPVRVQSFTTPLMMPPRQPFNAAMLPQTVDNNECDDMVSLTAADWAIVSAIKVASNPDTHASGGGSRPRHLSAQDVASCGRARPPPQEMRSALGCPVSTLVVPMAPELAMRLSNLTPLTGRYLPHDLDFRISSSSSDDTVGTMRTHAFSSNESCYLWRNLGSCCRTNCRFSHDAPGHSSPARQQMLVDLGRSVHLCAFHIPGTPAAYSTCKKGAQHLCAPFVHSSELTSRCHRHIFIPGDSCPFLHI